MQEYINPVTYEPVKNLKKIVKHYLQGWFLIDFIAILPLQFVDYRWYALKLLRLFYIGRFISLFDLSKVYCILDLISSGATREEQVETQYLFTYVYKIMRLLLIALLITYFLGLTMYIISDQVNYEDLSGTFITVNNFADCKKYEIVIRCMYFILTTITTVGFGDFLPYTTPERLYIMIVELFGVAFYSYIMGNFIEIVASYDKQIGVADKPAELQNWFTLLDRFTDGKPLDKEIVAEIEEYYTYFWREYKLLGVSKDDSNLTCAPKITQRALITKHLFPEIIYDFRRFFGLKYDFSTKFTYDMAFGFLPRRFKAGEQIYSEGEDVEELYFITKGIVSVGFTIQSMKFPAKEVSEKTVIGDYYVVRNRKSEFFYEAQTAVEAIGVTKEHFMNVLNQHPKKKAEMSERILKSYMELRESMKTARRRKLKNFNTRNDYYDIKIADKEPETDQGNYEERAQAETDKEIKAKVDILIEELAMFSNKLEMITQKYNKEFKAVSKQLGANPSL